ETSRRATLPAGFIVQLREWIVFWTRVRPDRSRDVPFGGPGARALAACGFGRPGADDTLHVIRASTRGSHRLWTRSAEYGAATRAVNVFVRGVASASARTPAAAARSPSGRRVRP